MEKKQRKGSQRVSRTSNISKHKPKKPKDTTKEKTSTTRDRLEELIDSQKTDPDVTHQRSSRFTSSMKDIFSMSQTEKATMREKGTVVTIAVLLAVVAIVLFFTILAALLRKSQDDITRQPRHVSATKMGSYRKWIAVVGTKKCEKVPRKIFARNGTIGDAAVATILCVCVVMPHRCGLGGGFFATYYNRAQKKAYAIINRERAPNAATIGMYHKQEDSVHGPIAVAVFGELRGYGAILATTGSSVPWEDLFDDAINYAQKGFVIYEDLVKFMRLLDPLHALNPKIRKMLTDKEGKPLKEGDLLVNKDLADTLRNCSVGGHDILSVGHYADTMADEIRAKGGIITSQDFSNFKPILTEPETLEFSDGHQIFTVPLPSGGVLLAYVMGIVDHFRRADGTLSDDEYTWHRIIEALKFGFGKRASLRDPDAVDITKEQRTALLKLVKSLVSSRETKTVSSKISDRPVPDTEFYGLSPDEIRDHGSGQICMIAPNGDAFAMTTTINTEFGAFYMSSSTGIWMNNVMNDFATPYSENVYGLPPTFPNYIAPWKRPMSSLAPSIVIDHKGDVSAVITSTGSGTILSGLAQVLMRMMWMGHTPKEAIDCGRIHNQLYPDEVRYEDIADNDIIAGLRHRGHKVKMAPWEGNVLAIGRDVHANVWNGTYDYRNETSGGVDGE
ncbi:scoloptoxin SSD14-like [Ornithodoros turicata]|uniref:scoloptoxin SSD14-like n=1 Tax=Ornithodoros turicata TaxID=34597 RepID=UPI0031396B55